MSRARMLGGGLLLAVTAVVAWEARTFTVDFPTDPLGPAAFPLVAAVLMALGGVAYLLEGPSEEVEPLAPGDLRRIAAASGVFVAYALLLAPLGFVAATTLTFAGLAVLFGGRLLGGLAVGLGFALLLFALFVWGLGLPLPVGTLAGSLWVLVGGGGG